MKSKIKQLISDTKDFKPYNQCITCENFGKTCGGANFLSMHIKRMGEWARIRKEYLGLTNENIAQATGVSVATVARFLAGTIEELKVTTAQAILGFLSNDFCGSMPCYAINSIEPIETTSPVTSQKIQQYEKDIQRLENQIVDLVCENQKKIDFLRAELEKRTLSLMKKDEIIEKKDAIIEKKDAIIERLLTK